MPTQVRLALRPGNARHGNYLNKEEEMNEYFRQVLADRYRTELAAALGENPRVRSKTQLAKDTKPSRKSLPHDIPKHHQYSKAHYANATPAKPPGLWT